MNHRTLTMTNLLNLTHTTEWRCWSYLAGGLMPPSRCERRSHHSPMFPTSQPLLRGCPHRRRPRESSSRAWNDPPHVEYNRAYAWLFQQTSSSPDFIFTG